MPAPLPLPALDRLSKLMGMHGSSHDGERANAAALATKLLKEHGWTWADVAKAVGSATFPGPQRSADLAPDIDEDDPDIGAINKAATECLQHPQLLNNWEAVFCRSMTDWDSPVSDKQVKRIIKLVRRVRAAGAGRSAA